MTTYPGLSSKHGPGALNPRMAKTCAVSKTLFIYCVGIGHCWLVMISLELRRYLSRIEKYLGFFHTLRINSEFLLVAATRCRVWQVHQGTSRSRTKITKSSKMSFEMESGGLLRQSIMLHWVQQIFWSQQYRQLSMLFQSSFFKLCYLLQPGIK